MHMAATRLGPGERVRRRASCGAVSATKLTGPAAAVADAVSSTADSISTSRSRSTRTPRALETSSPISVMRSARELARTTGTRTAHSASSGHTWAQSRPSSDPVIQTTARAASTMSDLVSR